ncbi:MAG: shikimate dehydrogenase family protein [Coraliomargarita sp.]
METERTYTLADLETENFGGTPLAVLGYPVKHSVSPAMHNAAIAKLRAKNSRFSDWTYYRFEVEPEDLCDALPIFHQRSFLGLNLTVPHKVLAMDAITGVSPDGERMGAVNTLVWDELGYDGFNTDGYGLKAGLEFDLGASMKDSHVILLGSGGAARAAAVQCLLEGCAQLYVGNRSPDRLSGMIDILSAMPGGQSVQTFALHDLPADLPENGIVVNATSLGLKPEDPAPINVSQLPSGWKVYDMIYNPQETRLLKEARAHGLATANGLSMLVHQGARSLEIWSHEDVDARAMMSAACHALHLPPRYD